MVALVLVVWWEHEAAHGLAARLLGRPHWHHVSLHGVGTGWDATGVGRRGALVSLAGPLVSIAEGYALLRTPWPAAQVAGLVSLLGLGLLQLVPFRGLSDGSHVLMFLRREIG